MTALHASDWDRDAALTTARILLEIKAVNFRPEEPYTFTSGWKSPVYIDCRKIISFPRARNRIMELGVENPADNKKSIACSWTGLASMSCTASWGHPSRPASHHPSGRICMPAKSLFFVCSFRRAVQSDLPVSPDSAST